MPNNNLDNILTLYNPWWEDAKGDWRKDLPDYRRPVVTEILSDIAELPQIISISGSDHDNYPGSHDNPVKSSAILGFRMAFWGSKSALLRRALRDAKGKQGTIYSHPL